MQVMKMQVRKLQVRKQKQGNESTFEACLFDWVLSHWSVSRICCAFNVQVSNDGVLRQTVFGRGKVAMAFSPNR